MEPTRPVRPRRRMAAALLVSIALHLAAAWWFARARPGTWVSAPEAPPIDLQIVQVPAPVSRAPERKPATRTPEREPAPRAPSTRTPERSAPSGSSEAPAPVAGSPGAPRGAPLQIDLTPRLGPPGEGPAGKGRTITNHPETPEEHGIAIAEEAGQVKARVDGWIAADVGERKAQLGLIDPYFGSVRGALQKAVEKNAPNGTPGRNVGEQLVDAVLGGATLYGKTGNPYGEGQVPNAGPAEREFTGHAEEMARRYPGSQGPTIAGRRALSSEQMQQCADQGKLLDDFLSGKFGGGLTAVVELSQAPDGKLLEARLVTTSGLPAYDRHVLSIAPAALADLPPPPAKGFGIKPGGIKSLWRFEGRVKFKRPLKEWDPLTGSVTGTLVGALYGLACPGLGPPVTFDAATGQLELIDLAHPKFTCQVKLIRVE